VKLDGEHVLIAAVEVKKRTALLASEAAEIAHLERSS
jgi:hypothetical protein